MKVFSSYLIILVALQNHGLPTAAAVPAVPFSESAACSTAACRILRLLREAADRWDKKRDNRDTVASAYSSQKGQDPTGAGDAFTMESAESSSTSNYDGVYYNDDGKTARAGDMAKGGWAGAYNKNIPNKDSKAYNNRFPAGTQTAIAYNFDTEMSSQRGPMAIAGTYEGSRAVAGSSAWWNAAQKDSWGGQSISTNIDTYGPAPGKGTTTRKGDDPYGRRSVAFTNNAPNSAAQTGAGNGPAAISSGYETASSARAARDRKDPPVSLGHREDGKNGVFESATISGAGGRRLLRRLWP